MAFSKLTCPECDKVLRPAKPVAAGKKVKCPSCDTIFVAGGDDDDDDDSDVRPRKKTASKKGKAPAKEPPKKEEKKPEEETYGYIKDDEDESGDAKSKKPKIDYLAMNKSTDLRGPALVKLSSPAAKLQMIGLAGTIGWLALILVLTILVVFPVREQDKEKETDKWGNPIVNKEKEKKPDSAPFTTSVYGYNLGENYFIILAPIILSTLYSALVVAGSIKMATLESRAWGIAGSIMALLPILPAGLASVIIIFAQFGLGMVIDDKEFIDYITMGISVILYLICLGIGAWCLIVLNDEEVKDGFEYDPE